MSKIFAIGDIHGCISELNNLMKKLDIKAKEDTLVFIGDYIDRGPDSKGVINSILEIRQVIDHVVCLKGNHEQMFLNYHRERLDEELFMENGGMSTLISYGFMRAGREEKINVPESHMQFFSTLLSYYETDHYIFVHAGLRPGIPLKRQDMDDLLWIREEFINSSYNFGKTVVFGHTPVSLTEPLINKNKIGIDTGAVYGGKLTCVELPELKVHQV
jgi:serine/threonine protein phosphatase 1